MKILSGDIHRLFPPLGCSPPPLSVADLRQGGGNNHVSAEGRFFFEDFVSKSVGQRYENALKAWFLQRKSRFVSVKSQKFRACGAATLPAIIQNIDDVVQKANIQKCNYSKSNYSNIVHEAALSKQFSNLQAAIALSTHAQNVSYSVAGALRLDNIWFTSGYGALYACTKRLENKKCAAGAKNWNTRAKTIVSGVKNMENWLKYSKK